VLLVAGSTAIQPVGVPATGGASAIRWLVSNGVELSFYA
jgi:hypothetical protein